MTKLLEKDMINLIVSWMNSPKIAEHILSAYELSQEEIEQFAEELNCDVSVNSITESLREYLINPENWEDVLYPTITTDFYNDIDEVEKNLQFPDMLGEVLETDKEIDFSKCYTYGFAPKLEPICHNFVINIILNESGDKIIAWIMSQD